jgi:hypothetical protein
VTVSSPESGLFYRGNTHSAKEHLPQVLTSNITFLLIAQISHHFYPFTQGTDMTKTDTQNYLAVAITLLSLSFTTHTARALQVGDFTYEINTPDTNTITLTGYTGAGETVHIPTTMDGKTVLAIGNSAFDRCTNLVEVTIPDSVLSVNDRAFNTCYSLTNVVIGSSVTNLGFYAFRYCTNLTNITIPNSVTTAGDALFFHCFSLSNAVIGSGVNSDLTYVFWDCPALLNIEVHESNQRYSSHDGVLFDKDLSALIRYPEARRGSYDIPESVNNIGEAAFYHADHLTHLEIPYGVTNIGQASLCYCLSLTNLTIPDSVLCIDYGAINHCSSLTNISIGSGVTYIGTNGGFAVNTSLLSIHVDPNNPAYCSISGILFDKGKTELIAYPESRAGNYRIPDGVQSIGEFAFAYSEYLTNVTIPQDVVSINKAFSFCTNLEGVYFEGNAPTAPESSLFWAGSPSVYIRPGTTGWDTTFSEQPVVLWNPQIQTGNETFGVQTNGFGFNITELTNALVVVHACTNLEEDIWEPVFTNSMPNGSAYFSDPTWADHPARYYRLDMP